MSLVDIIGNYTHPPSTTTTTTAPSPTTTDTCTPCPTMVCSNLHESNALQILSEEVEEDEHKIIVTTFYKRVT